MGFTHSFFHSFRPLRQAFNRCAQSTFPPPRLSVPPSLAPSCLPSYLFLRHPSSKLGLQRSFPQLCSRISVLAAITLDDQARAHPTNAIAVLVIALNTVHGRTHWFIFKTSNEALHLPCHALQSQKVARPNPPSSESSMIPLSSLPSFTSPCASMHLWSISQCHPNPSSSKSMPLQPTHPHLTMQAGPA